MKPFYKVMIFTRFNVEKSSIGSILNELVHVILLYINDTFIEFECDLFEIFW